MTKRPKPYIWASWLPRILAGESQCLYQPWLKSHYKYEKRPDSTFDLAEWTRVHNALVESRAAELRAAGWAVTVENQNDFKLKGTSAILAGKCDIVAERDDVTLIVDGKTGQQKHADWWQVLIYMLVLPRVRKTKPVMMGEVLYADHRIQFGMEKLGPDVQRQIWALIKRLGESDGEATTPSAHDCGWCDIAECRDRFVPGPEYLTDEF